MHIFGLEQTEPLGRYNLSKLDHPAAPEKGRYLRTPGLLGSILFSQPLTLFIALNNFSFSPFSHVGLLIYEVMVSHLMMLMTGRVPWK